MRDINVPSKFKRTRWSPRFSSVNSISKDTSHVLTDATPLQSSSPTSPRSCVDKHQDEAFTTGRRYHQRTYDGRARSVECRALESLLPMIHHERVSLDNHSRKLHSRSIMLERRDAGLRPYVGLDMLLATYIDSTWEADVAGGDCKHGMSPRCCGNV